MNVKAWAPLGLALALGLAAAVMAKTMMNKDPGDSKPAGNLTPVVVAKKPLEPGHKIQLDDLTVAHVDRAAVPENAFVDPGAVAGRVSAVKVAVNQQLFESLLTPDGAGTGLAAVIPPGMRAITVEVNEFSSVAGMLNPGCRVDVLGTFQHSDTAETLSRTIVQNVKITAVGQRLGETPGPDEQGYRSVTLLVTPQESEKIELATNVARIRLVLRSGLDKNATPASGITLAELRQKPAGKESIDPFAVLSKLGFGPKDEKPATKNLNDPFGDSDKTGPTTQPTIEYRQVKIIRGGAESQVQFEIEKKSIDGWISGNDTREAN